MLKSAVANPSGPYHANSAPRPQAEAPGTHTSHSNKQATDLLGNNGCSIRGPFLTSWSAYTDHRL